MLLGSLLEQLKDTGLDSRGFLSTAWLRLNQVGHCFKLRCNDSINFWAKILEDSDHCATFACITMKCLETDHVLCQAAKGIHWRSVSETLTTEVCRYVDHKFNQRTQPDQPFVLRENDKYWIGPVNSGLMASVRLANSPTLGISRIWPNVPEKYKHRLMFTSSLQRKRLRERGGTTGGITFQVAVRARQSGERHRNVEDDMGSLRLA